MALMQELNRGQIRQSLDEALERGTPVNVTCCVDERWYSLRSGFLALTPDAVWLERPVCRDADSIEIGHGLDLGFTFKLRHHKHIFNLPVEASSQYATAAGQDVEAIRVALPRRMQRVQRRAYLRAEVPRNRSILATFRLGGPANGDPQPGDHTPTWEGWVTNISAGGFQVRLARHGAPEMDLGDPVGVSIAVGQEFNPIQATAQFRQVHTDDRGVIHHGFQFVGLNETVRGRKTLQRIGQIVCDFQRFGKRRTA